MKRSRSAATERNDRRREAGPGSRRRGRNIFAIVAGLGVVVIALMIGERLLRPPRLPEVDAAQLEARAKTLVQSLLDDVRKEPKSGAAWGRLGMALRALHFRTEAQRCFAEAERLDPADPRWPFFQAALLSVESPDNAIAALRRAVHRCGNEPESPRLRLAKLLGEQGRWEEAGAELRALIEEKPENGPALFLLAQAASAKGDLTAAIQWAERCTQDPRTARGAWSLLATLRQRQGNTSAAAEAARQAADLPNDPEWSDPFEAEAALLLGDPRQLSNQAHLLLAAGRRDAALPLIQYLVQTYPQLAEGWLLLGRFQLLDKQAVLAEQTLQRHLQLDPQSTQGFFQLGMTLLAQDRNEEAAAAFGRATELKPDYGPAYFNRGFALARSGKLREAADVFREAIRHNPEHAETYFLLADLHLRLGEKGQAIARIREAEALRPTDPRLRQLRLRADNGG